MTFRPKKWVISTKLVSINKKYKIYTNIKKIMNKRKRKVLKRR